MSTSTTLHRRPPSTRAAGDERHGAEPSGGGGGASGGEAALVQVEFRGRQLQAQRGSTLRTALLEAGVTPHNGRATLINCRGLGTCGTCAVEVRGQVEPPQWTTQEQLRLNFPPHAPPGNQQLRLACQVACEGDLVVVVKRSGFWGQGQQVLSDLGDAAAAAGQAAAAGVMPLGQLEIVMDRRRRRRGQQQQ